MDDPRMTTNHRGTCVVLASATPDDRFALGAASEILGFRLLCFQRFRHAVEAMREEPVDIVICEQQMPDGDWKELAWETQNLRKRPTVIVIGDEISGQLWSDVHRGGGAGVLMRPLRLSKIDAALQTICTGSSVIAGQS